MVVYFIYIYIYIYEWIVRPGINLETTSTLYVFGLAVSIITYIYIFIWPFDH